MRSIPRASLAEHDELGLPLHITGVRTHIPPATKGLRMRDTVAKASVVRASLLGAILGGVASIVWFGILLLVPAGARLAVMHTVYKPLVYIWAQLLRPVIDRGVPTDQLMLPGTVLLFGLFVSAHALLGAAIGAALAIWKRHRLRTQSWR